MLRNARPRSRAGSAPPQSQALATQTGSENSGWVTNGATYTNPYPVHPPLGPFMTPMGPYYPPQYSQPIANPNMPLHTEHAPVAPPTTQTTPSNESNEKSPQDYPDIITWCQYLDSHIGRNQDGIVFEPFGTSLKKKGFVRITQLTSGFVDLKDLQGWLEIEVGTAILIMQYAKMDVQAINAGRLFFPRRQNEST
jgi:hypothetical protein